MDLLSQTKYLIKKIGLKPDRFKGQNFCVDENVIKTMVQTAAISQDDTILEVGPGLGFLTQELLKSAGKVIAVELDKQIVKLLRRLENVYPNLEVVEGNILRITNDELRMTNYKIVANLPYNITSAFLKKFLTAEHRPESMTLLLQKEVAERICAKVGQMSLLSVSVQLYSQPKIIRIVSRQSFWPMPKVDSAILQIDRIQPFPFSQQVTEKVFWQVVRFGFSSKRKQLHNNLRSSLHLTPAQTARMFKAAGLDEKMRAQELSLADWVKLAQAFNTSC